MGPGQGWPWRAMESFLPFLGGFGEGGWGT